MQKIIKLLTKRTVFIADNTDVFETDTGGTYTTDADETRNYESWLTWIWNEAGISKDSTGEFLKLTFAGTDDITFLNQEIADFLGFEKDIAYPTILENGQEVVYAPKWGTAILILQGSENTENTKRGQSMLKDAPINNSDFKNDTIELAGFNAINEFDKSNFKRGHDLVIHNLDREKEDMVIDFFDADSQGNVASNLNCLGFDWRIKESKDIYLKLSNLKITDHVQRNNTIEVSFSVLYV